MKFQYQLSKKSRKISKLLKFLASSLLWRENRSSWPQYFIEFSSNIQLILIAIFSFSFGSLEENEDFLPIMIKKIDQALLIDIFESICDAGNTLNPLVWLMICGYFLGILYLFGLFSYKYLRGMQITHSLHACLTYCAQLHHTIIFWGFNIFLMSSLIQDDPKAQSIFDLEGVRIVFLVMKIFLIMLNYLFGIVGALFCYDPFFTKNPFACYSSRFQTLTFVYKAIMCPMILFVFAPRALKWIFGIFSTILALLRQELLFFEMPYYKSYSLKFFSILCSCTTGVAITNMIAVLLSEYEMMTSSDVIYLSIIVTLLLIKLNLRRVQLMVYHYLSSPQEVANNQRDIFKKIFGLVSLYDDTEFLLSSNSDKVCNQQLLQLMGLVSSHASFCNNIDCFCQYVLKDKTKTHKGLFELHKTSMQSKISLIMGLLSKTTKHLKGNNLLKLLLAQIYLKKDKQFSTTLFLMYSMDLKRITLQENILFVNISQHFEYEAAKLFGNPDDRNGREKIINIKQVVDFEKNSSQVFGLISQNTQSFLQLWDSFLKPNTGLSDFIAHSIKAETEADKIAEVFAKTFAQQKHLSLCICLYGSYLAAVRNVPSKAEKVVKHYNEILEQKIERAQGGILGRIKLDGSGDVILYISMSRERLGRVIHVSRSIHGELGWNQADLIGQNINMIQPSVIKEQHDHILANHIERQNPHKIQNSFESFALKKEGYCVPVVAYSTIFPYILDQPMYAGIIRKNISMQEFLIVRLDGTVDAFSEGIAKELDLPPYQKINIDQICLNFPRNRFETKSNTFLSLISDMKQLRGQEEITLTFQNISIDKTYRRFMYATKIENMFTAGQQWICLHLGEQRFLDFDRLSSDAQQDYQEDFVTSGTRKFETYSRGYSKDYWTQKSPDSRASIQRSQDSPMLHTVSNLENFRCRRTIHSQFRHLSLCNSKKTDTIVFGSRKVSYVSNTTTNILLRSSHFSRQEESVKCEKSDHEDHRMHESSQTKSSSLKERVTLNDKLEQAMYAIPKQKYTKTLNYLIALFTILCASFMIFHLIDSYSEFNFMLQKIDLLTACHRRTLTMIIASSNIRVLALITKGIFSDSRHTAVGIPSWKDYLKDSLLDKAQLLHSYHFEVSKMLYILDQSSQLAIFNDEVVVKRQDSKIGDHLSNELGFMTDMVSAINTIAHLEPNQISLDQSDVEFVVENSFNNPLVVSERMIVAIMKNCKERLFQINKRILVLLFTTISSGVIILILLLIDVKYFLKHRNQFIEILLRLDKTILRNHIEVVERFYQSLRNNLFNFQLYLDVKEKISQCTKTCESKTIHHQKLFKSKRRLNIQLIRGLLLTLMILIGFASSFIVLFAKFNLNLEVFMRNLDSMTRTYRLHANLNLLDSGVIECVALGNSTMIRNKPIGKGLSEIFDLIATMPTHLTQVVENNTEIDNDLLHTLIIEDLCRVISTEISSISSCEDFAGAIVARGLISMTDFLITGYQETKSQYDLSNHTLESGIEALNSEGKIIGEQIAPFISKAIFMLEDLLRENLKHSVLRQRKELVIITIIYTGIYVGLGLLLSLKVWKKMKMERESWRKIVRQIPFSIILSDKLLKAYIINNCDCILDSFKNII